MKVLDFLKSFIFPTKMFRFRNMSVLISLLIFVLSTYLLSLPFGKALADSVMAQKETYNFRALTEIVDNLDDENRAVLEEIRNLECEADEKGQLACASQPEEKDYEVVYVKNGVTKHVHIFFDFYDPDKDEKPRINVEKDFSIENDAYKYVENEEHYFLVFTRKILHFQAHQLEMGNKDKNMEITHGEEKLAHFRIELDYANFFPDFSLKLANPYDLGGYVAEEVLGGLAVYYRSMSFLQTILVTLLFPLLMVLMFWLFFRKTGRLTRFKEYFNISAISSIIPLLLVFAVAWFLPVVINYYIFAFSLFYLFCLFKINNMRTEE